MIHRMKSSSVLRIALSRDEGPKELIQHHLSVEAHQKGSPFLLITPDPTPIGSVVNDDW